MPAKQNACPSITFRKNPEVSGFNAIVDDGTGGYDLRDTLRATVVREASFAEFRAVLAQYRMHLH